MMGIRYKLEYDLDDPFIVPGLKVAYCDRLTRDFMPVIYDPWSYGSTPFHPELVAYRLVVGTDEESVCIIYEVYWKCQDCTWRELNKDHDHDYEQIQVHIDVKLD